jgi:uncharacterized coiled-coil DUF342 family protein
MSCEQKNLIETLISDLKQQRDELRLKVHLGGEDLKDQLNKLDAKLLQLSDRYDPLKHAVEETSQDVWDTLKELGHEIKEGFQRIRKAL